MTNERKEKIKADLREATHHYHITSEDAYYWLKGEDKKMPIADAVEIVEELKKEEVFFPGY